MDRRDTHCLFLYVQHIAYGILLLILLQFPLVVFFLVSVFVPVHWPYLIVNLLYIRFWYRYNNWLIKNHRLFFVLGPIILQKHC